ncbi:hypothetical protein [Pseudaestuariivita atlantica]|uniref:Uncharacterized protein n=1 Tax=Pseudaestuariivita atlantica TaxID=1317121 RepID=A0A0L1JL49_9RHOB|nr:hypothetical protein [Pseudaestuariivita atlantica]KNG92474.1 hypothetical protein ATO11_17880 [Pseudaestuariivita atlantica]
MNEVGTIYKQRIRGSEVMISQIEPDSFELFIDGNSKQLFSSASEAREALVHVIIKQTGASESTVRNEVPMLGNWQIFNSAPFDPET